MSDLIQPAALGTGSSAEMAERMATPGPASHTPSSVNGGKGKGKPEKPRSLFTDAVSDLRRSPVFWVALVLVVLAISMAVFPTLFTSADPRSCALSRQHVGPSGSAFFGYDYQGCDVYARAVYGARNSVVVGFVGVALTTVLALVIGMSAGYFGGWLDSLLSRVIDIVLGVPFLLAGVVLASRLSQGGRSTNIIPVILVLGLLGWTSAARVIRSSVISAKNQDYVAAARMLGARSGRIMWRHILPNALAPMVVVLTIALGAFISSEATLSFLGVGLKGNAISWGIDIATGQLHVRQAVAPLLAPASFLGFTVLGFIMLGDAIRDAFDPKLQ
jgi:oligopeptide transport system permease protein